MKRYRYFVFLLPITGVGAGCFPSEYYRDDARPQYQYRSHPPSHHSYAQPPQDRPAAPQPRTYAAPPPSHSPSVSPRSRMSKVASHRYYAYLLKCRKNIRLCKYRRQTMLRAIQALRQQMSHEVDPYRFDHVRGKMYYYHQQFQRYHRCVLQHQHRMRWARAYFYQRYGVDLGYGKYIPPTVTANPAAPVTPGKPSAPSHQWSQPPTDNRHAPPWDRDGGKSTPGNPTPTTPKDPNTITAQRNPSMITPPLAEPNVQQPKANPDATEPTPNPDPSDGAADTDQVQRWQQYCAQERPKYPLQTNFKYIEQKAMQMGKHGWQSRAYAYTEFASIRPLSSSGGRYVFLSLEGRYSHAHCDDKVFTLWDTSAHRAVKLRPPVTQYLLQNPHLLPWFQGKTHASIEEQILYYDPAAQQAGLLIKSAIPAMKGRSQYLYLRWDLRANRISHAWALGSPGCHSAYRPIGVSTQGQTLYYLQNDLRILVRCGAMGKAMARANGSRHLQKLMALDVQTGNVRTLANIADSNRRIESFLPTSDFSKIALIEYAEMKTTQGKIYVVHTNNGQVRAYPAPLTVYGATFTPDMQTLLAYSSKAGQIVQISLADGAQKAVRTNRLGHAMGLSRDGKHIFTIFHGGIEVRDLHTLKPVTFLPHRNMMGAVKFIHVDGSAVNGGVLFVKNGERLYIQKFDLAPSTVSSAPTASVTPVIPSKKVSPAPVQKSTPPTTVQKKTPAPSKKTLPTRPAPKTTTQYI